MLLFPRRYCDDNISEKDAAALSSYSLQYLRRLLRSGKLDGLKISQVWLIEKSDFAARLLRDAESTDRRFGPQA